MAKDKDSKDIKTTDTGSPMTTTTGGTGETVTAAQPQAPQTQLRIDESSVSTFFSSTSRIWGTAEEIMLDFSQGVRPAGRNVAVLKIDSRVVMTPWAAKRLAIALGQTVQRYEQAYGTIEIDPRRRGGNGAATTTAR